MTIGRYFDLYYSSTNRFWGAINLGHKQIDAITMYKLPEAD
jgi:hypothetical protein